MIPKISLQKNKIYTYENRTVRLWKNGKRN